jgi:flagellar motility protein MotE (MotC chaperone)
VLRNMKERPAAQVLAALDPGRAAALSNMLSAQKEN